MPCCKVPINKNFKCDKDNCLCIPTEGKSCVCLCQNKTTGITQRGGKCQCTKCTCCKTAGFSCVCVCKDDDGKIKICEDCSCGCTEEAGSSQEKAGQSCVRTVQCKGDDAKCVCLSTGGASCICVCTDEKGNINTCTDCSCTPSQGKARQSRVRTVQCKCDDAKCVCLSTGGASCICVCTDEKGNIKTYTDCSCTPSQGKARQSCVRTVQCKCDDAKCVCLSTGGASCICVCIDEKGNIKTCTDCSCTPSQGKARQSCVHTVQCKCDDAKCVCLSTGGASCICVCTDEKGNIKTCTDCSCTPSQGKARQSCVHTVQCKCDDAKCVCLSTGGASCICVCTDEKGNIKTCTDCSCTPSQGKARQSCVRTVQCKCDDAKCVCLSTGGASCICVCTDEKGNIKTCTDCSCTPSQGETSFQDRKAEEKSCKCVGKATSCICVCSEQGKLVCCDDCKCDEANKCDKKECTCVVKESGTTQTLKLCDCKPETCKNMREICCDDCKCEENNTCGKIGCACSKSKNVEAGVAGKPCDCIKDADSCICDEECELVCFKICKCNEVKCYKEGCACVPGTSNQVMKVPNTCHCKTASCVCICEGEDKIVCCKDCKCDDTNKCDKEGCLCVPKSSDTCVKGCICAKKSS